MQSSGQYDNVESTALAKEDRADNSDVPKIQRESIRTRRERLHGMGAKDEGHDQIDHEQRDNHRAALGLPGNLYQRDC
jgi:hypothetical protein